MPAVVGAARPVALAWALAGLAALVLGLALVSVLAYGHASEDLRSWTAAVIFTLLGVRFATHAPRNPIGWLMLAIGSTAALTVLTAAWSTTSAVAWLGSWIWLPTYTLLPAVALLFPDGRLVTPRWGAALLADGAGTAMMAVGLGVLAWPAPRTFWDDSVNGRITPSAVTYLVAVGLGLVLLAALAGVAALALRWRRQPHQRGILSWAAGCALLTVVAGVLEATVASAFWSLAALALPAAAAIAVLRYGLFDIDLIIHRSLLYGLLSIALLLLYAAVAYGATYVVPDGARAAAAVAVVLATFPLRAVVQSRVDRWLYGDRAEPYRALSGLGHRLGSTLDVDQVLPAIAEHVASALKAPYVRAGVDTPSPRSTIAVGRSRGWPTLRVPLTFRGAHIGEIVVETRAPDEHYSPREVRLLSALADAAGSAAQAVVLTEELRLARERLVLAREEERRRLRRDLHDGVGAALAGTVMQLKTVSRRLPDTDGARQLLAGATADLVDLTGEVRRLVDGLRPADLDRGLAAALHDLADPFAGSGLSIDVSVDELPALPAALEVAAYHIAAEALANVARHANARHCRIAVGVESGSDLRVEIADDGVGLTAAPPRGRRGLGTTSMRERAAELGGSVDIEGVEGVGTRVVARMPFPAAVASARQER